jgi:hypothetical protein
VGANRSISRLFLVVRAALPGAAGAALPAPSPSPGPIVHPAQDRRFEAVGKAVEHTPVKDQGNVGFCWSYSTTGRLEAEYLRATGRTVDLSEEYVAFFHIYEQLLQMAPTFFTTMEKKPGKSGALASIFIYLLFHPSEGAPDLRLANRLIGKYGIVPESAFSYKIRGGFLQKTLEGRVRRFINQVLRDPTRNRELRLRDRDGRITSKPDPAKFLEALARVYTLESEFDLPRKPDDPCRSCELLSAIGGFEHEGARVSPKQFARDTLGFHSTDWKQTIVTAKNHASALERIDQELAAGHVAEIGITLFGGYSQAHDTGVLSPESCGERKACESAGGHALLVVNRVVDPRTGKTSGYVLKNSWGTKKGRDSEGEVSGEALGYDIITPDYLSELYSRAKVEKNGLRKWYLLVRKAAT